MKDFGSQCFPQASGWRLDAPHGLGIRRQPLQVRATDTATTPWWWLIRRVAPVDDVSGRRVTPSDLSRSPKLARLEAALFVAGTPLSLRKLVQFASLASLAEGKQLLGHLSEIYIRSGSAFRVEKLATGYRLYTRPEFAPWLDRIHHRQAQLKLSTPMLETLTIIAYRQPITRADVEAIRGVQSAEMIKQLMERGLIRITGEDDSLGRPYLYGTTRLFLEQFGLGGLDDLPHADQMRQPAHATTPDTLAVDGESSSPEEVAVAAESASSAAESDC